ncbi:MAG: helix-turn-helix transcriptional regulator [Eubacteriales bacterium]|jgi:putative transcriptional regulator
MRRKNVICQPFDKIKGLMREKRISQQKLSEDLNISIVTLNKKLNGTADWTWTELEKMITLFEIPDNLIESYFFPKKVS